MEDLPIRVGNYPANALIDERDLSHDQVKDLKIRLAAFGDLGEIPVGSRGHFPSCHQPI